MTFSIDPDFWLFQPGPPQDAMPGTASPAGSGRDFAASLLIAPAIAQGADANTGLFTPASLSFSAGLFAAQVAEDSTPPLEAQDADLPAPAVALKEPALAAPDISLEAPLRADALAAAPSVPAEENPSARPEAREDQRETASPALSPASIPAGTEAKPEATVPGDAAPAEETDASTSPARPALAAALKEPALAAPDISLEAPLRADALAAAPSAPAEENPSARPEAREDRRETTSPAISPASIPAGTEARQDTDSASTPAIRPVAAISAAPAATALPEAPPITQGLAVASAAIPPRPVSASQMRESATPQPTSVEPTSGKPLPETAPSQTVRVETIEPSLDTATSVAALSGTERQSTGGEPQQALLLATVAPVTAGSGPTSAPVSGLAQLAPAQAILVASAAEIPAIVARASSDAQNDRITVQLDPPELGRVSIDFKFDAQGLQHVTVTAETPEAMRQLRAMHFELVQALERQGFSGQEMTFQQQTPQQKNEQAVPGRPYSAPYDADGSSGGVLLPETSGAARQLAAAGGRLDLRL